MKFALHYSTKKTLILIGFLFALIGALGFLIWTSNDYYISQAKSLSLTNRSINTFFGAVITSMALIITLTSNLYSPMLSRVFVSHPLTILGISYILLTNFFITITHQINVDHPWYDVITFISFSMTIISMLGAIPFLFLISKFVKPSYFVPLLGKYSIKNMLNFHNKARTKKFQDDELKQFFELIDVINNMASTSIIRRDKRTLKIVIDELFYILENLIDLETKQYLDHRWRFRCEHFSTGLGAEAQYYLKKNKVWAETYLLQKILEHATTIFPEDNEIIPHICKKMTNLIDLSNDNDQEKLIQLQLMILNSILNHSIKMNNEITLTSVFYYYRLNIELLIEKEALRDFAIENFFHYGKLCLIEKKYEGAKSFLYDTGRILHYLCFESEVEANKKFISLVKPTYDLFKKDQNIRKDVEFSVVKTFWTLYSQNYTIITQNIKKSFLQNNLEHAKVIKELLSNSQFTNREFNENLISPAKLSGMAEKLAKDFHLEFKELR